MSYGILYDSVRCVQCGGCADACKIRWGLPDRDNDKLSQHTFTVLEKHDGHPLRRMCMHCLEPACASVCPVRALERTPEGPVVYHADRCMGCRYCMMACPFKVPRYEWDSPIPRVRKCVMCHDRVAQGKRPVCTLFCPVEGIKFGDRDALLAEAKERIAKEPGRYYPHVYGENEVGGTSVLVIAAVPPEQLGLPVDVPDSPLPQRTWQVLSRLPGVVAAGAAFCLSMYWLIGRRDRIAAEAAAHGEQHREKVVEKAPEHEEILK